MGLRGILADGLPASHNRRCVVRDGASDTAMEARGWDPRLPHVEEDRRDEPRRKEFRSMLRVAVDGCVCCEIFHGRQRDRIPEGLVEQHLNTSSLKFHGKIYIISVNCIHVPVSLSAEVEN